MSSDTIANRKAQREKTAVSKISKVDIKWKDLEILNERNANNIKARWNNGTVSRVVILRKQQIPSNRPAVKEFLRAFRSIPPHPHLARVFGSVKKGPNGEKVFYTVDEVVEYQGDFSKNDLEALIEKEITWLNMKETSKILLLWEIVWALWHLHSNGLSHGNLSLKSIRCSPQGVKLSDFSYNFEPRTHSNGTEEQPGPKYDMLMFGRLVISLFEKTSNSSEEDPETRVIPFPLLSASDPCLSDVPVGIRTIIFECLQGNPELRPSSARCFKTLEDDFLRGKITVSKVATENLVFGSHLSVLTDDKGDRLGEKDRSIPASLPSQSKEIFKLREQVDRLNTQVLEKDRQAKHFTAQQVKMYDNMADLQSQINTLKIQAEHKTVERNESKLDVVASVQKEEPKVDLKKDQEDFENKMSLENLQMDLIQQQRDAQLERVQASKQRLNEEIDMLKTEQLTMEQQHEERKAQMKTHTEAMKAKQEAEYQDYVTKIAEFEREHNEKMKKEETELHERFAVAQKEAAERENALLAEAALAEEARREANLQQESKRKQEQEDSRREAERREEKARKEAEEKKSGKSEEVVQPTPVQTPVAPTPVVHAPAVEPVQHISYPPVATNVEPVSVQQTVPVVTPAAPAVVEEPSVNVDELVKEMIAVQQQEAELLHENQRQMTEQQALLHHQDQTKLKQSNEQQLVQLHEAHKLEHVAISDTQLSELRQLQAYFQDPRTHNPDKDIQLQIQNHHFGQLQNKHAVELQEFQAKMFADQQSVLKEQEQRVQALNAEHQKNNQVLKQTLTDQLLALRTQHENQLREIQERENKRQLLRRQSSASLVSHSIPVSVSVSEPAEGENRSLRTQSAPTVSVDAAPTQASSVPSHLSADISPPSSAINPRLQSPQFGRKGQAARPMSMSLDPAAVALLQQAQKAQLELLKNQQGPPKAVVPPTLESYLVENQSAPAVEPVQPVIPVQAEVAPVQAVPQQFVPPVEEYDQFEAEPEPVRVETRIIRAGEAEMQIRNTLDRDLDWQTFGSNLVRILSISENQDLQAINEMRYILAPKGMVSRGVWDNFVMWFSPLVPSYADEPNSVVLDANSPADEAFRTSVPYFTIRDVLNVVKQTWFFGFLDPSDTQKVLLKHPTGTFLFRFSSQPRCYTLSVSNGGQVGHWRIRSQKTTDSQCFWIDDRQYTSLQDIMQVHMVEPLKVNTAKSTQLPVRLDLPVKREEGPGMDRVYDNF